MLVNLRGSPGDDLFANIRRSLFIVAAASLVSTSALADRTPPSKMPIRSIDRPLSLLEDHFELRPDVFVSADRSRGVTDVVVGLFFGAGYGITDDFEVGLTLLRLTLSPSPNTGIDVPSGYLMYRLLDGPFEVAALAELELPINDTIEFRGSIPMLLHLPPIASLRIEPSFLGLITVPAQFGVSIPAELRIQIVDRFSVGALASLTWPDLKASNAGLLQFGGLLALTLEHAGAASAEIRLSGRAPGVDLSGPAATRPIGLEWVVLVDALIYFRSDPDDTMPESPF